MNPYASFLGTADPVQVIAETPGRVSELVRMLGLRGLERSLSPGKWSVREILAHLADCELAFAFRLRQTLAEPHHVMQPFDQDAWAKRYAAYDGHSALMTFIALRTWNRRLIETVTTEEFATPVSHPERGDMTFRTIVETMAGHDLNHLRQIETIASAAAAHP